MKQKAINLEIWVKKDGKRYLRDARETLVDEKIEKVTVDYDRHADFRFSILALIILL